MAERIDTRRSSKRLNRWRLQQSQEKRIMARMRSTKLFNVSGFLTSCSQTRMTTQFCFFKSLLTVRARSIFPLIFCFQYCRFPLGSRKHFLQPCQKQPSTKTASRFDSNQKSGLPGILAASSFHPQIPCLTRAMRSLTSVDLFPLDRTLLINRLRPVFVSESTAEIHR